jgi:serine protease SohB
VNPHTAKALAIVVNSPGGLPVQSDIICAKIKSFAHQHHLPLYTFAEDVAASGGYFVLCIGNGLQLEH